MYTDNKQETSVQVYINVMKVTRHHAKDFQARDLHHSSEQEKFIALPNVISIRFSDRLVEELVCCLKLG